MTGLPKMAEIYSSEMMEALSEPAMAIVEAVHSVLERTPPELAADIIDRGIYMTGGGCLVRWTRQTTTRRDRYKCNDCRRRSILCCIRNRKGIR